jgi:uncharacterized protein YyaL (SSP411 family)
MTKVISVRIPMTGYMDFIKKASQNKLTVSEFLFTKLFSEEDTERDKNEIVELKAALIKSNESATSLVNERDALHTAWVECNERVIKIANERDTLNMELRECNKRITSMANEYDVLITSHMKLENIYKEHDALKATSKQAERYISELEYEVRMLREKEDIKKKPRKKIENIGIETS